jgi:hypothetical protein
LKRFGRLFGLLTKHMDPYNPQGLCRLEKAHSTC